MILLGCCAIEEFYRQFKMVSKISFFRIITKKKQYNTNNYSGKMSGYLCYFACDLFKLANYTTVSFCYILIDAAAGLLKLCHTFSVR